MTFVEDPGSKFTVASDRNLGFSRVTVQNKTHLYFEHFLSDSMTVFDSFTIYKPLTAAATEAPQISDFNSIVWWMYLLAGGFIITLVMSVNLFIKVLRRKKEQQLSPLGTTPFKMLNNDNPEN